MSKEFIKDKVGSKELIKARRQQLQLSQLTQSDVQDDVDIKFFREMTCGLEFKSDDPLLKWVNAIFKEDNFKTFFKYLRYPLASTRVVQEMIVPHLERVFFSEDSYFDYTIRGERVPTPEELDPEEFNKIIFDALLYRHNDLVVHDLKDVNKPFRYLVSIDDVVSIESKYSKIKRVAFTGEIVHPESGKSEKGYIYIDDTMYAFYDKDLKYEAIEWPHDIGVTPVEYVSSIAFNSKKDPIRKSIFSTVREKLEEYVFLKTLQRMSEPNGAIPIATKMKSSSKKEKANNDESTVQPMSATQLKSDTQKKESNQVLQTGTIIEVPIFQKEDGSLDSDAVQNFMKFHYMPVENLEYINTRIDEIEKSIITSVVGDYSEQNNENSKNELQVSKSYDQKQDKLRKFGYLMSKLREKSDKKFLMLQYGPDAVEVDISFGTDFFLETQDDLYNLFNASPNPIERQTILKRLAQNRGRFNPRRAERDEILYRIQPFASDKDFEVARAAGIVDPATMQLQLRLSYWLSIFESYYGDILDFWEALGDIEQSQKFLVITELLNQIIEDNVREQGEPDDGGDEGEVD